MSVDTEIRLSGEAARAFCQDMISGDLESINARDEFLSRRSVEFDEQGLVSVDISDLNIDFSVLGEHETEVISTDKQEAVGDVWWISLDCDIKNEEYDVCADDELYSVDNEGFANQENNISFAA